MSHITRDYLERTIATVRNHRDADNCWPQWANIFADEIERLWAENEQVREALHRCRADMHAKVIALQRERTALREAIRHVVDDSPGTPASVKRFLAQAVLKTFDDVALGDAS